jgi:NADH-quinone oxidoreductase subunit N
MVSGQLHLLYPQMILALGVISALLSGISKSSDLVKRSLGIGLFFLLTAFLTSVFSRENGSVSDMLQVDAFSRFFLMIAVVAAIFVLLLAARSAELARNRFPEFTALLLTICIGISLIAATRNLLFAYLAMEMISLSSYVLTGFKRNDLKSHEAALKYVIYGGVASGVMVFGISLLYGLTGSVEFTAIAQAISENGAVLSAGKIGLLAVVIALTMILSGLCFKIAAVPFHMWSPDIYQGAPTSFTAFLSVAPKAAGFALLLRFFMALAPTAGSELNHLMIAVLGLLAAVTMTLGNLTAIHQTNVKRLLAYSSIAHAGYLLMGAALLNQAGASAVLLYLGVYLFMNLGAFAVVQAVADHAHSEEISAFKGLGARSPLMAVLMSVFLFSLAGIPPLAGFIGKFYLFAALLQNAGFWYVLLAVVGILNSVVALFYYARIIMEMYMKNAEASETLPSLRAKFAPLLIFLALPILILGIYWEPLQRWASAAAAALR